jgi:hypothetical protein
MRVLTSVKAQHLLAHRKSWRALPRKGRPHTRALRRLEASKVGDARRCKDQHRSWLTLIVLKDFDSNWLSLEAGFSRADVRSRALGLLSDRSSRRLSRKSTISFHELSKSESRRRLKSATLHIYDDRNHTPFAVRRVCSSVRQIPAFRLGVASPVSASFTLSAWRFSLRRLG